MSWYKSSFIFSVLVVSLFLGDYLKPTLQPKNPEDRVDFETLIPKEFGDWKIVEDQLMVLADPELEGKLAEIYSQNISRTYVDSKGNRIMLSLAYGDNQEDSMQVHKPEVCYPAQGFAVLSNKKTFIDTGFNMIPARVLNTVLGNRNEFVLYWILVGDKVVDGGLDRKLQQLSYGLKGIIPDGLLFRVSSIGKDFLQEQKVQKSFIVSLLQGLNESERKKLIGN